MSTAALALQRAAFAALTTHTGLTATLGGPRIYDDPPQNTPYPYVTFASTSVADWSTGTEPGDDVTLTLHVWSRDHGRRSTLDALAHIRAALHHQPLTLAGHRLVDLRHEHSEARRDVDNELIHGIARFRALIEPA
jgi:poly(3-hydroxybutyrate) depolymerase